MDGRMKYALGFAAIIGICILTFALNPNSEFAGADGAGGDKISEIAPDYEPWASNLWEPPSEMASLLFALQAAIGAIVIGYFIGNEHGKRSAQRPKDTSISERPQTVEQEKTDKKTGNT